MNRRLKGRHQLTARDRIGARITMLEFVLEVMLANVMSDMEDDQAGAFRRNLLARARVAQTNNEGAAVDSARVLAVALQSTHDLAAFLERAASRAENIRDIRASGQTG